MAVASGVFACWKFLLCGFFCLVSLLMMGLLLWSFFCSSYAAPSSKLLGKRNLPSQPLLIQTLRRWLIPPCLPHQSCHTTTPLFQHHCWELPIPIPCKWFLSFLDRKLYERHLAALVEERQRTEMLNSCIQRFKDAWADSQPSTFPLVSRKPKIIVSVLKCEYFIVLLSQQNTVLTIKSIYDQGDLEVPD